jgi:hypothetical protein
MSFADTIAPSKTLSVSLHAPAGSVISAVLNSTGDTRMARAIPITVGDIEFPSKASAGRFFSEMLSHYDVGVLVSDSDARHFYALVKLHPDYELKTKGQEIVGFDVNKCTEGTKCFYLRRLDGYRTHFSYKVCLGLKAARRVDGKGEQPDLFKD